MEVYRIENEAGFGPYVTANMSDDEKLATWPLSVCHNGSAKHPGAYEDFPGLPEKLKPYVCGFASEKQLRKWFYGFIQQLRKAGYFIAVYHCNPRNVKSGYSGKQLFFKKRGSFLVDKR